MTFAINLALLIVGTIAALAAFGGETWRKGNEPLSKRITNRGWLALVCMFLTLSFGVAKEIRNNLAAAVASTNQRELENKLESATISLTAMREKIDLYQGQLAVYQEIVGEIKNYSVRQEQIVMVQAVTIAAGGTWEAPNKIYSGSKVEAYFYKGEKLQLRYEGMEQYLRRGNDDWAKLFVIGPSGKELSWKLHNPSSSQFEGKIEVISTPRSRSKDWSWLEEKLQNAIH